LSLIKIKSYNDLTDLQFLALVDFSYSRIDTYQQCPAKYLHSVLESVLDNEKTLDINELEQEYNKNISVWDPDNNIPKDLISVGSVILQEFYDQYYDKKFNIYEKELPFNFIIGCYKILGFIDRVDVIGDRVNIVDYKTGKWEVALKDVPNNLQLGIYALAMHNIFPEKEIYAELHYLRSGKKKGHLFTNEDIENVKINLISSITEIINDTNFTPTSNARVCSYCDHAKSGACPTGVFRNKKNNGQ